MLLRSTKTTTNLRLHKQWLHIDAKGLILGRLATKIATLLRGKHKPSYTSHRDDGDYVIITNASKVALSGQKMSQKTYYWHTGYPGGIKSQTPKKILEKGKAPQLIILAVKRMLPKTSSLARKQLKHLFVYSEDTHPHQAQNPTTIDFASQNPKNTLTS